MEKRGRSKKKRKVWEGPKDGRGRKEKERKGR